jgi:hypothetical protein
MSTEDVKTSAVPEETPDENNASSPPETETPADIKKNKPLAPVILFLILGIVAGMVVGWVIFPKLLYSKQEQPIDFNHVLHTELVSEGCESCHFFRTDGTFSGVPKLEHCINCHEEQQGESANEAKFVKEYVFKGIEVPWLIYSRQPDSVFFSHAAHIKAGKMECITCHGPIDQTEHLKPYEENRLTGYSRDIWGKNIAGLKKNPWDRMKMDDCANCHATQTDLTKDAHVEPSLRRLFTNSAGIVFPNSVKTGRKSSVQTDREACFVCHK